MNIRLYTNTDYQNYSRLSPASRKKAVSEKTSGNFDTVTFQKTEAPSDDASFARMLTKQISSRVGQEAEPEKVARLRQQVASGNYRPDSAAIARRMLGYY